MSTKPRTVAPAAEAVEAAAWMRTASSEAPDRFRGLVLDIADQALRGRPVREPARLDEDPVLIAAHIEALSGLRRLRARLHCDLCVCRSCKARRTTAPREDGI